jgi:hypothetical protein
MPKICKICNRICQKYAKYAKLRKIAICHKCSKYAKYAIQNPIGRICPPHFANAVQQARSNQSCYGG